MKTAGLGSQVPRPPAVIQFLGPRNSLWSCVRSFWNSKYYYKLFSTYLDIMKYIKCAMSASTRTLLQFPALQETL